MFESAESPPTQGVRALVGPVDDFLPVWRRGWGRGYSHIERCWRARGHDGVVVDGTRVVCVVPEHERPIVRRPHVGSVDFEIVCIVEGHLRVETRA